MPDYENDKKLALEIEAAASRLNVAIIEAGLEGLLVSLSIEDASGEPSVSAYVMRSIRTS